MTPDYDPDRDLFDDDFPEDPDFEEMTPDKFFLNAAIFEGALIFVAIGVGWLFGISPFEKLIAPSSPVGWYGVWTLTWQSLLTVVPMVGLFFLLYYLPVNTFADIKEALEGKFLPLFQQANWVDIAVISLLAGVGEEALFRGALQDGIAEVVRSQLGDQGAVWFALLVASLLFGLVHFITRTYALIAAVIGFYLGAVYLWSGSLIVPIAAHAIYDFFALSYLLRRQRKKKESDLQGEDQTLDR